MILTVLLLAIANTMWTIKLISVSYFLNLEILQAWTQWLDVFKQHQDWSLTMSTNPVGNMPMTSSFSMTRYSQHFICFGLLVEFGFLVEFGLLVWTCVSGLIEVGVPWSDPWIWKQNKQSSWILQKWQPMLDPELDEMIVTVRKVSPLHVPHRHFPKYQNLSENIDVHWWHWILHSTTHPDCTLSMRQLLQLFGYPKISSNLARFTDRWYHSIQFVRVLLNTRGYPFLIKHNTAIHWFVVQRVWSYTDTID